VLFVTKLASDGSVLAMIVEEMRIVSHAWYHVEESQWLVHVVGLWTIMLIIKNNHPGN
jgi:hypothetical protein